MWVHLTVMVCFGHMVGIQGVIVLVNRMLQQIAWIKTQQICDPANTNTQIRDPAVLRCHP